MFGKPAIGEVLHVEQELDNAVNTFAMKVVKNNETVSHLPCKNSRTQMLPLGATTHEKVIEQEQHVLSFFCVFFLTF